jgi:hypothetical protein
MYKRLNITLPDDVLARADEFAQIRRYTRSGLIAEALDAFVADEVSGGSSIAEEASAGYAAGSAVLARSKPPELEHVTALLRAFFSARDDVEAAWVFGSVAQGTAGPMSDVDVAVLPARSLERDDRWALRLDLMGRLQQALGLNEVDVAVVGELGVTIAHRALVNGLRVFGEHSRGAAESEIAALRDYVDFEPVSRLLDARLKERVNAYGPHRP